MSIRLISSLQFLSSYGHTIKYDMLLNDANNANYGVYYNIYHCIYFMNQALHCFT